ncbi:Saccharopine dehydrogenase-domain-containing protein [Fusarium avenaceum]|nr:Saccharopine dehydrogenase-domain-containing protein [Fusarium avenaceum]
MAVPDTSPRSYGIVVLGASGFTGTKVCTHIAAKFPPDLKWAIASRSRERLDKLAARLRKEYPDRVQPDLEIVTPDDVQTLGSVIGKAKVCISCVVYSLDGGNIVRVCIERGTDYVDCDAVPTMCRRWIDKYHKQAEEQGVALILGCGFRSGAMDLLAIHGCHELAQKWSAQMGTMSLRIDLLKSDMSGGTMQTILSFASEDSKVLVAADDPSYLTPVPYPNTIQATRGIQKHPLLGMMTNTSPAGIQTRVLVNRSWGLLGGPKSSWGPNFQYNEYEKAESYVGAIVNMIRGYIVLKMLSWIQFPWFRNFISRNAPPLGQGPSDEKIKSEPFTSAAVIEADQTVVENRGKCCYVELRYQEGGYPFAAMIMAQAAATLLYDRNLAGGINGGCLTAGVLGPEFVKRAEGAGLEIKTTMIEN